MMKWPFSYPVIGNEGLFVFSKTNKGYRTKRVGFIGDGIVSSVTSPLHKLLIILLNVFIDF